VFCWLFPPIPNSYIVPQMYDARSGCAVTRRETFGRRQAVCEHYNAKAEVKNTIFSSLGSWGSNLGF
jgi:hypothetical protein